MLSAPCAWRGISLAAPPASLPTGDVSVPVCPLGRAQHDTLAMGPIFWDRVPQAQPLSREDPWGQAWASSRAEGR